VGSLCADVFVLARNNTSDWFKAIHRYNSGSEAPFTRWDISDLKDPRLSNFITIRRHGEWVTKKFERRSTIVYHVQYLSTFLLVLATEMISLDIWQLAMVSLPGSFVGWRISDDHGHNYLMNVGKFQEREEIAIQGNCPWDSVSWGRTLKWIRDNDKPLHLEISSEGNRGRYLEWVMNCQEIWLGNRQEEPVTCHQEVSCRLRGQKQWRRRTWIGRADDGGGCCQDERFMNIDFILAH
jgi:hypothetical protein